MVNVELKEKENEEHCHLEQQKHNQAVSLPKLGQEKHFAFQTSCTTRLVKNSSKTDGRENND